MESYCGEDIEKSLGLGQEGLVGLALLLGCDYLPKGVPGVGKEQVLKLVKLLEGVNILGRCGKTFVFSVFCIIGVLCTD